jgi:hypothetical protein
VPAILQKGGSDVTDHREEEDAGDGAAGACRACGLETRAAEDGLCEFCAFLRTWFTDNKIDAVATGKTYGAAKIVKPDGTLVAYVPFREDDDLTRHLAHHFTAAGQPISAPRSPKRN